MRTPKFGASNRKLVDKATKAKKAKYECPKCRKKMLERKGNALWLCKSCGSKYAGAAYSFTSESGEIAKRLISEYSES
ncbi:50S ribosomal protein L37ae [Candidatus Micrarchaeota archaeon]|nr:50S ribosomal protein L37ae [Candidatus Micrarchaeota archaeon]